jgi:hypothetical protein
MSATPLQVKTRPFAIEPITNIMLPDGIFDNALYHQRIACHFTNVSTSALSNVTMYLESVGDPGIVPVAKTHVIASVPAGASVIVSWDADFQHATPGKKLISFVAQADGFDTRRSIQTIFVSETRFDAATNSYTCTVEEGTLTASKITAIAPRNAWGRKDDRGCDCSHGDGPWVPTGMTLAWAPNPAYAGPHGDLPFSDPWWKVLAIIILIIAAIVAIVAAAMGAGQASFSVGGTFDETQPSVNCCSPKVSGNFTVAGVASAIASIAAIAALSDAADPFWRGQEATPPAAGELTTGEEVVASWTLTEAPNAGRAFPVDVSWAYTRATTGGSYTHSVAETQVNEHVSDGVDVVTPDKVKLWNPLWVHATFAKAGGVPFTGIDLYAFALFRAPQGLYFVVPMTDDGIGFDEKANDGTYSGGLDLEGAYRLLARENQDVHGLWQVYVFAQEVNQTKPGTPPEIAARHIGGFFVASAIELTFDPTLPCPMKAHGTILVV